MLHDAALFAHCDHVCVADRAEPVRDDHRSAVLQHAVEVALDRGFGLGVEGARRLAEQHGGSW
jgi:hypothetical protein